MCGVTNSLRTGYADAFLVDFSRLTLLNVGFRFDCVEPPRQPLVSTAGTIFVDALVSIANVEDVHNDEVAICAEGMNSVHRGLTYSSNSRE